MNIALLSALKHLYIFPISPVCLVLRSSEVVTAGFDQSTTYILSATVGGSEI